MKQNISATGERKQVDVSYFKIVSMRAPVPKFHLPDTKQKKAAVEAHNSGAEKTAQPEKEDNETDQNA